MLGEQLDLMILQVFSNLNDSMILRDCQLKEYCDMSASCTVPTPPSDPDYNTSAHLPCAEGDPNSPTSFITAQRGRHPTVKTGQALHYLALLNNYLAMPSIP